MHRPYKQPILLYTSDNLCQSQHEVKRQQIFTKCDNCDISVTDQSAFSAFWRFFLSAGLRTETCHDTSLHAAPCARGYLRYAALF